MQNDIGNASMILHCQKDLFLVQFIRDIKLRNVFITFNFVSVDSAKSMLISLWLCQCS